MEHDASNYLEIGPKKKQTHFVFAGEVTVRMLVAGAPVMEREAEIIRRVESIVRHLQVSSLIDIIFAMYVGARKLFD